MAQFRNCNLNQHWNISLVILHWTVRMQLPINDLGCLRVEPVDTVQVNVTFLSLAKPVVVAVIANWHIVVAVALHAVVPVAVESNLQQKIKIK